MQLKQGQGKAGKSIRHSFYTFHTAANTAPAVFSAPDPVYMRQQTHTLLSDRSHSDRHLYIKSFRERISTFN